jgi:hypothetical protein
MALIYEEDSMTPEQKARTWRDQELAATDMMVAVPDHPQREEILSYRIALRDWPNKDDNGEYISGFPDIRPEV